MKIILESLTMTKTYDYKPLEKKRTENGYVRSDGSQIVSDDDSYTFIYDCSNLIYFKVISADNKNSAPYSRFVDANNTLIGEKIIYTKNGETVFQVPSGAVEFQVTDTWNGRSNQISVYGKKG